MPVLLLVTFLLWNCITDFALKHDFTKLIFFSDNINSQPFVTDVTAYDQLDRSCEKWRSIRVKKQRNILHEISKQKANWIGHIWHRKVTEDGRREWRMTYILWCMLLLKFEDPTVHYLETRNFLWDSTHILCMKTYIHTYMQTYITNNIHNLRFCLSTLIFDFVHKDVLDKLISALKTQTLTLRTDSQQFQWTGGTCCSISEWSDVQPQRMSWILCTVPCQNGNDQCASLKFPKDTAGISPKQSWSLLFQHSTIPKDLTQNTKYRAFWNSHSQCAASTVHD
jgi:hypothetical protein